MSDENSDALPIIFELHASRCQNSERGERHRSRGLAPISMTEAMDFMAELQQSVGRARGRERSVQPLTFHAHWVKGTGGGDGDGNHEVDGWRGGSSVTCDRRLTSARDVT